MNCRKEDMLLYVITDRHWLNGETLYQQVEKALKGGVTFLQLREKNLDEEHFMEEAREIKKLCGEYQVPFIINDNVEIAQAVGADGVHVGQSDMEAGDVRARLGADKIIGVSAKTVEQGRRGGPDGGDCLGGGAGVSPGAAAAGGGVAGGTLKAICEAVKIPVVAIGGITKENIKELAGCGADGIAVISAIFAQPDIEAAAKDLRERSLEMIAEN